ncbi:MAG: anthranilate phosphoribosyltransferase [Pseudomonadota bacterium]
MDIYGAIDQLIKKKHLSLENMKSVMRSIMSGDATPAQIGAFLIALRIKGETSEEVLGAASIMREFATPVSLSVSPVLDIVGTGGDGASIFNVSTASCFVAAAAGAHVAKHGNRSVTSSSGSADLLEAAGVNLSLSSEQVQACIEKVGFGFMYAINHHPAMKYAASVRKELKIRTIFNVLGPLTNPASAPHMLVGVYDKSLLRMYAEVLRELNIKHALIVRSDDGLDELSIATTSQLLEVKDGTIREFTIAPESVGLKRARSLNDLVVSSPQESLEMITKAFKGQHHQAQDMIALNSGAALYTAGLAKSIKQGVALAQDTIGSGMALAKLEELSSFSQVYAQ